MKNLVNVSVNQVTVELTVVSEILSNQSVPILTLIVL